MITKQVSDYVLDSDEKSKLRTGIKFLEELAGKKLKRDSVYRLNASYSGEPELSMLDHLENRSMDNDLIDCLLA